MAKRFFYLSIGVAGAFLLLPVDPAATKQGYYIELDIDGQLGNGPDIASGAVSDYIDVNVWIMGDGPGLWSSNFTICNLDGSLEFQGYTNLIPPPWTFTPPMDGLSCLMFQNTDFTFSAPMAVPFIQGVAIYHCAVDQSVDDITIDTSPTASGWFNSMYESGAFDATNASIQIGTTETEPTHWGDVKSLFR